MVSADNFSNALILIMQSEYLSVCIRDIINKETLEATLFNFLVKQNGMLLKVLRI